MGVLDNHTMGFWQELFSRGSKPQTLFGGRPAPATAPQPPQARSVAAQPQPSSAPATPAGTQYADQKWGFSLRYPEGWAVAAKEHVEGEWHKPVVLVRSEGGERVAVFIVSIGKMHKGGTIAQYMEKARTDLSRSFQEFTLASSTEKSVNKLPTGWMHYRYVEQGRRNEEYNVTFFLGRDTGVPFQIVCFTDIGRFARLKEEFTTIIQTLSFLNNRLWLPHISLYGSSGMNCRSCGSSVRPETAIPFIKFPENEIQVMCSSCKGKV